MKIKAGAYPEEKDIDKWVGFLNNGNVNIVFLWRYAAYCRDIIKAKNIADVGLRDTAEQKYLYELYLAGKGNVAAAPGSSWHEYGFAIDLNRYKTNADGTGQYYGTINADYTAWLQGKPEVLNQYGLSHAVKSEIWHIQPVETIGVGDKANFADADDYLRNDYIEPSAPGMKKGDKNDDVKSWQTYLNSQGATLDPDGDWGRLTESATVTFFANNNLEYNGYVDITVLFDCLWLGIKKQTALSVEIGGLQLDIKRKDVEIALLKAGALELSKTIESMKITAQSKDTQIATLQSDINGLKETIAMMESDNLKLTTGLEQYDALLKGVDIEITTTPAEDANRIGKKVLMNAGKWPIQ